MKTKLILLLCATLVLMASCEKNEQTQSYNPYTPSTEEQEDFEKYAIVGNWKCTEQSTSSGNNYVPDVTMEIKKDGSLSFVEKSVNSSAHVGSGSWTYNSSDHTWRLNASSTSVSGTYKMIGNTIASYVSFSDGSSRTTIFTRQ